VKSQSLEICHLLVSLSQIVFVNVFWRDMSVSHCCRLQRSIRMSHLGIGLMVETTGWKLSRTYTKIK